MLHVGGPSKIKRLVDGDGEGLHRAYTGVNHLPSSLDHADYAAIYFLHTSAYAYPSVSAYAWRPFYLEEAFSPPLF